MNCMHPACKQRFIPNKSSPWEVVWCTGYTTLPLITIIDSLRTAAKAVHHSQPPPFVCITGAQLWTSCPSNVVPGCCVCKSIKIGHLGSMVCACRVAHKTRLRTTSSLRFMFVS